MKRQLIDKFLSLKLRQEYLKESLRMMWSICDDYAFFIGHDSIYTINRYNEL